MYNNKKETLTLLSLLDFKRVFKSKGKKSIFVKYKCTVLLLHIFSVIFVKIIFCVMGKYQTISKTLFLHKIT